jgi:hypothetical protein
VKRRKVSPAVRAAAAFHVKLVKSGAFATEPPIGELVVNACAACGRNTTDRVPQRYRCTCLTTSEAAT